MKNILISCILLSTYGLTKEYQKADRILDMQTMEKAMQTIQSGFFYNNIDMVEDGAKNLKSTVVKIKPIQSETNSTDVYQNLMSNSSKITKRTQKRIINYSDGIIEHFKSGDAQYALNVYNRITAECMKCHTNSRTW